MEASRNRLIDENKVWEYVIDDRDSEYQNFTFTRYKFSGTEDKFGKIYHRWIVLESQTYINEDVTDESSEWTSNNTTFNELVALLREEDGKVYMLLDRDEVYEYDKDFNPFSYDWDSRGRYLREVTPGMEAILYDSTAEEGYSYDGFIDDNTLSPVEIVREREVENEGMSLKESALVSTWGLYLFIYYGDGGNVQYG